jgi:pantoate kinase
LRVSEAFCPAGISSFFEVCNLDSSGNPIADPARIGARGGGFAIPRGATSRTTVKKSAETKIKVKINSKPAPEAHTTRSAIEQLLKTQGMTLDVAIDLKVACPIGAGFGTSAAGTLASCLAVSDAADIAVTVNELGRITHVAEVVNRTGLGTAAALLTGGFVLVTEPGAPGIGFVDRLLFPKNQSIVCAYTGPIWKRETLGSADVAVRLNAPSKRAMDAIRQNPNLPTFLAETRQFAQEAGFETPVVTRLISTMISSGATGATQNMIGEAVHGVANSRKVGRIVRAVKKTFPAAKVFATPIDNQGVRLIGK